MTRPGQSDATPEPDADAGEHAGKVQRIRINAALAHAIAWGAPLSILDDDHGQSGVTP